MHPRNSFAPVLGALLWAAPGLLLSARPAISQVQPAPPATALISALRNDVVTLAAGTDDGVLLGAIYEVRRGETFSRFQVNRVEATQSTAQVLNASEGFVLTVGDTARFVEIGALPTPLEPVAPTPLPTTAPNPTPTPSTVTSGTATTPSPDTAVLPPAGGVSAGGLSEGGTSTSTVALTGSTASVLSVDGNTITVSAGFNQGAKPGQNVPILRGGNVIGLAKLSVVRADDSTANVLVVDEGTTILPGDAAGIMGAAPTLGTPTIQEARPAIPARPVPFETGASNVSVPKNSMSYRLLASLASSGLIQSQPARIFHDNGARRHNVNEDVIFSRAQIAGFIQEAIGNGNNASSRDRAALAILVKEFRSDLEKSGSNKEDLDALKATKPSLGVTTWSRATFAGGDKGAGAIDPFSDSYGQRRSRSGLDTNISAFGNLTENLEFFANVDTGSRERDGGDLGTEVRNLYLRYDATKLLRGLSIELGRQEQWWGVGQFGNTTLGDAAGGLDMLKTRFARGSYELTGFYSRLGRGPDGGKRSLYGQTAALKIGNSGRVGLNTTILSPKDEFDPKLFAVAFTPISLYAIDRDKDSESRPLLEDTNAILSAFGELGVARGARVYGEVVLDDISLNSNNRIENRNGSLVGVHLFNPRNPAKSGFKFEYARFNAESYLYLPVTAPFRDRDYTYYQGNAPLAYPVSPRLPTLFGGAESFRFEGYIQPTKRVWLSGGIEFSDINASDQDPAPIGGRGFSRQQIYRFSATYDLTRNWSLTGRAQRVATDQPNFIKLEPSIVQKFFSIELARAF